LSPREHFTARQTSYYTLPGVGDHATDAGGGAFSEHTTARYYVDGLDVMAAGNVGSVVAFGDSITDGFQSSSALTVPETTSSLNTNGRWPDDLQRRLLAAGNPTISILNAGISGNKVLSNAQLPLPFFGPGGLSRFRLDALDQAGVTEIIVLEGINDIGSSAAAAPLEAGLQQLVTEAHAAGLKIQLGTLTPAGSAAGAEASYGTAQADATRQQVNTWIRSGAGGADGFVDFDAAVRSPADPNEILPAYNGGDGLHFDLAGYQAMANAVNLAALPGPSCPTVSLTAQRTRARRGLRTRFVFAARVAFSGGASSPLSGAVVRFAGRTARTGPGGRATIVDTLRRAGRYRATVSVAGRRAAVATVRAG
jgi:lysophospholipase L1-like esterase